MSNIRILSPSQIQEAKQLREKLGYTKKELADRYNVAPTTIWYGIYGRKRKTKRIYVYRRQQNNFKFTNIQGFIEIVEKMREEGMTSGEIAFIFNVPLEEINLIWTKSL